jgi:hypothetical protein
MSSPNLDTASLVAQVQAIAADYQQSATDAANWRAVLAALDAKGYGPNITPAQIVALIPDANYIAEVVAASAARKSRKGIPLGPRGSRPPGSN